MDETPISYEDRRLALAAALWFADGGWSVQTDLAESITRAKETAGGDEARLKAFAERIPAKEALRTALNRFASIERWLVAAIAGFAAMAGLASAHVLLDADRTTPVNVLWLLGVLLGPQLILLLAMIVVGWLASSGSGISIAGSLVMNAWRWIVLKVARSPEDAAAATATLKSMSGRMMNWRVGFISSLAWTLFNLASIGSLIWVLSTHQYTFCWESTWLSDNSAATVIKIFFAGPEAIGVGSVDDTAIASSRFDPSHPESFAMQDEATRRMWAGLAVGAVAVYGFAPRALLAAMCLALWRRARQQGRIDSAEPAVAALLARISPTAINEGIRVKADPGEGALLPPVESESADRRPIGPPAVFRLEVPAEEWSARPFRSAADLGPADSRDDRARVLKVLADGAYRPQRIIAVAPFTSNADRGIGAFLQSIHHAADAPLTILLTGGQAQRTRGGATSVEGRLETWQALAKSIGTRVSTMEVDLNHLTETSRAAIESLVAGESTMGSHRSRLADALEVISLRSAEWKHAPSVEEQGRLHRKIAELYRNQSGSWLESIANKGTGLSASDMVSAGERVLKLLPPSMRLDPRWLLAGAAAGALSCVAAAMTLSPAVIAGLPVWSMAGAAVSTVMKALKKPMEPVDDSDDQAIGDVVRSAALAAVLYEAQGLPEAAIGRVLEQAFNGTGDPCKPDPALGRSRQIEHWLAGVNVRAAEALSREGRD